MASLLHGRLLLLSFPWESDLNKSLIVGFATGAFSAALACLFLFSVYQCILRLVLRRRDQPEQQPEEHLIELDPKRSAELSHIPITVYDVSSSSISTSGGGGDCDAREGETSCVVCLTDFEGGEEVRVMPRCKHTFHRDCIDRWLAKRSSFCPVCRDRVIEKSVEATGCGDGTVVTSRQQQQQRKPTLANPPCISSGKAEFMPSCKMRELKDLKQD